MSAQSTFSASAWRMCGDLFDPDPRVVLGCTPGSAGCSWWSAEPITIASIPPRSMERWQTEPLRRQALPCARRATYSENDSMRSHQRLPQNSWPAFARATPPVAPSGRGRRDGSSPKRSVRVARRRVRSADTSALSSLLRLRPAGSTNGGALPALPSSDTTIRYQLDHPTLRGVHAVPKRKSGLPGASNARRGQAPVLPCTPRSRLRLCDP